jgi:hypothetical protein
MSLFKFLYRQVNLLFIKLALPIKIRRRADKYFNRTLEEFRKKYKRKPDRNEMFLLVVKASHRTAGIKRIPGKEGHIKRQWIRKYLLLKSNIRDKYKIQEAKN